MVRKYSNHYLQSVRLFFSFSTFYYPSELKFYNSELLNKLTIICVFWCFQNVCVNEMNALSDLEKEPDRTHLTFTLDNPVVCLI